ncbi:MAG: NAD(P)H-dependent oxidoreductase [Candidatus Omnitrophica bacterium]|nr:NAD(P)H-dependent oxidoreductase [Candidatus Omnitrophota bacterium]
MKISVILGHPTAGSFNHAIADAALGDLKTRGHQVFFHDLYAERFDPLLVTGEIPREAVLPADLDLHCGEIAAADGIIIIHPNWWSMPPAILKGWVDRVLRPGMAYNFEEDGKGGSRSVGLLRAKRALVVTTANNPQENEVAMLGDPLEGWWKRCVFGLCGVPVERRIFSPVILSTLDQRKQWLEDVRQAVAEIFP